MSFQKLTILISVFLLPFQSLAATAPGAPGIAHFWAPALKQAVGTAYEPAGARSNLWFTIAQGIITEVFYPTIDHAQVGDLQFLVVDETQKTFSEPKRDADIDVRYSGDGMSVLITGKERRGLYSFQQEVVTDSIRPVLRIRTRIQRSSPTQKIYVLYKPAHQNSGSNSVATVNADALVSSHRDGSVAAALLTSVPLVQASAGYVGTSDGWQDLSKHFKLTQNWTQAGPGNVALTAELAIDSVQSKERPNQRASRAAQVAEFELSLGFGPSQKAAYEVATASRSTAFDTLRGAYENGWKQYTAAVAKSPHALPGYLEKNGFARLALKVIKIHEDKLNRGAIVASLNKPGVPGENANNENTGGYHLVWPRDLYNAANALLAAGDAQTAAAVFQYLKRVQKQDGSWAQNFWVNGTPYWQAIQLDEVAFPILLAGQLAKRGALSGSREVQAVVQRAAKYIATHGPKSQQDRWEEVSGFIPSTIAPAIRALAVASEITHVDEFRQLAEKWNSQIEAWTLVKNGPWGSNYFLRTSPSGNPDLNESYNLANGAGVARANEIIDGGFLHYVRYGLRPLSDQNIQNTLRVYESAALGIVRGANGATTFMRYNRDFYGHRRRGGHWPILAGERGMIELFPGGSKQRAQAQLGLLLASALPSGHLPEQTISGQRTGQGFPAGLGVACPLVWSHAEALTLGRSIIEGRPFESSLAAGR